MPEPDRLEPAPSTSDRTRSGSVAALSQLALAAVVSIAFSAEPVRAQESWVMDKEVTLTLRTGAGTQYRIIGSLKTGDVATILSRGDGWTKVRTAEGKEGWVSAGFLQASPPAQIKLELLERNTEDLREQVAELSRQAADLRAANEAIGANDEAQRHEIDRLNRENFELRAGARWPEWITGAGIVLVGMALGALLGRNAGRRRQPRVRL